MKTISIAVQGRTRVAGHTLNFTAKARSYCVSLSGSRRELRIRRANAQTYILTDGEVHETRKSEKWVAEEIVRARDGSTTNNGVLVLAATPKGAYVEAMSIVW